jgi:quinol monooxygenase YgiN
MYRRRFAAVLSLLCAGVLRAQQPQLHVVTYVDVYPNFAAQATEILSQFRAASRADEGSVRFEVMRDVARSNHFAIVEVWQSRALYEAHLAKPHNREFRDKLQPMLGSPFDERLYNLVP